MRHAKALGESRKNAIASLVAGITVCVAFVQSAAAQEQNVESRLVLDEVVVTAQRRQQNLQDVPISVVAANSENLAQRAVNDLNNLVGIAPSLTVMGDAGTGGSNFLAIRGISGLANPSGGSQAVAVYLDGVYLPRMDSAVFTLDDVERIEVLNGPQGTLYGRNATAGAINIITRVPGDEFMGGFDASYGNFETFSVKGSMGGPLGGGFSASISAAYEEHDGYFKNRPTGHGIGALEASTVRGKLRYQSDGDFSATLALDYSKREDPKALQSQFEAVGGVVAMVHPLFGPILAGATVQPVDYGKFQMNWPPDAEHASPAKNDSTGAALTLEGSIGDNIEWISITAAREAKIDAGSPAIGPWDYRSGLPLPPGLVVPYRRNSIESEFDTFTQELRAVISNAEGSVILTTGANYYKEDAEVVLFERTTAMFDSQSSLKSLGLFGQLEFALTDRFRTTIGLRYNKDDRDFTVGSTSNPLCGGLCYDSNVDSDEWLPALGISYKLAPDVLLYASANRGYQTSGYNPSSLAAPDIFEPETLDAYEIGVKSQFWDRRMMLNAAAFHYRYEDLQVRTLVEGGAAEYTNAAKAEVSGAELSFRALLTEKLTLSGNLSYIDAQYKEYCEPITPQSPLYKDSLCADGVSADRSGNALNYAPEWLGSVSANYSTTLGSGKLSGTVTFSYQGETYFDAPNLESTGGSSNRWDARLGYQLQSGLEIYLYGRNLANDQHYRAGLRLGEITRLLDLNDPRTYGLGVRYSL